MPRRRSRIQSKASRRVSGLHRLRSDAHAASLTDFLKQPPRETHPPDLAAGTTPLWTNGTATVFARKSKDANGFLVFDFGNC